MVMAPADIDVIVRAAADLLREQGYEVQLGPACIRAVDGEPFPVSYERLTAFACAAWRLGLAVPYSYTDASSGAELADTIGHVLRRKRE